MEAGLRNSAARLRRRVWFPDRLRPALSSKLSRPRRTSSRLALWSIGQSQGAAEARNRPPRRRCGETGCARSSILGAVVRKRWRPSSAPCSLRGVHTRHDASQMPRWPASSLARRSRIREKYRRNSSFGFRFFNQLTVSTNTTREEYHGSYGRGAREPSERQRFQMA